MLRLGGALDNLGRFWRALSPEASHGSAGWLSPREARRAGLTRRRPGSRFAGVLGHQPLWLWTETHHLILGPAGSAKSTAGILNILCSTPESALVNDTKGELYLQTKDLRARRFGHRVVKIDPLDPAGSVSINPLDPITEALAADSAEALTLVRGMGLQLLPEPQSGGDTNKFFRDGSRSLIATAALAVASVCAPEKRTLATVYRALTDMALLNELLIGAARSERLGGELAQMADSLHALAFGEEAGRTFENFRTGAVLALEAFGPGNYLAAITETTDFSFTELKARSVTVFIVIDYANKDVLGAFSGLMQWLAAYQLVRVGDNRPVLFVLDEFCNSPLHGLPTMLTLLRSYGIKCILATQDLDDITRVYGQHALETILSETDLKQLLGGIRSYKTLEWLSRYLGERSETTASFALQKDGVQESLGLTGRRLMSEDELRRLDRDHQIVLAGNLKPILARKIQVFSIAPWRHWLAPNPMYGGRRKLLPVAVRLG